MEYHEFFSSLKRSETSHVRALWMEESCAVTSIPSCFVILLADVVKLIHTKRHEFCDTAHIVGLFGLQIAAGHIQSDLPKILDRIYEPRDPHSHFCGVLNYLILPNGIDNSHVKNWQGHQSLIIDFTTGEVMDDNRYLLLNRGTLNSGKIYGKLSFDLLEKVWGGYESRS